MQLLVAFARGWWVPVAKERCRVVEDMHQLVFARGRCRWFATGSCGVLGRGACIVVFASDGCWFVNGSSSAFWQEGVQLLVVFCQRVTVVNSDVK